MIVCVCVCVSCAAELVVGNLIYFSFFFSFLWGGESVTWRKLDVKCVRMDGNAGFRQLNLASRWILRCWWDVKVLQKGSQSDETDVLNEPVAHTRPLAGTKRDKIFGFHNRTASNESRRVKRQRSFPVVGRDVQFVIVEEDHGPFLNIVTYSKYSNI